MSHRSQPAPAVKPVYSDASEWPAWTDEWVYEPTPEERGSAAAMFEADDFARVGEALDRMAAEAEALAALTRGLTPADSKPVRVRSPRSRPVSRGSWGDDDQVRAFGHV
jgi:hypothetical protein